MAYILGFTIADGCIVNKYNLTYHIHIKDITILEFIAEQLHTNSSIRLYEYVGNDGILRKSGTLSICSKAIIESLYVLNVHPSKTGNEIFPNIPEEYLVDFLRGYFDGDGCIVTSTQIQNGRVYGKYLFKIVCANLEFINQLRIKTLPVGNIRLHQTNLYAWQVQSKKDICNLYELMYHQKHTFSLERKRLIFEKIIGL